MRREAAKILRLARFSYNIDNNATTITFRLNSDSKAKKFIKNLSVEIQRIVRSSVNFQYARHLTQTCSIPGPVNTALCAVILAHEKERSTKQTIPKIELSLRDIEVRKLAYTSISLFKANTRQIVVFLFVSFLLFFILTTDKIISSEK